ncbi:MAG: hypothetical protein EP330_19280 [Deltaproteobacteria bacterium]|nr:MAG: hypothetical protein EP330_19280 [Deltaproteobacteria bacterium]
MGWDDVRLSRFQERRGTSWWMVLLALIVGAAGGYYVGRRSAEPPPPPPPEPSTTVVAKDGPRTPRDPLLAALHASSPVQSCFAKYGSRKDEHKHDVIQFAVLVNSDGSVESASITAPGRTSLQGCLMEAVGQTTFPRQRAQRDVGLHTEMGSWFR